MRIIVILLACLPSAALEETGELSQEIPFLIQVQAFAKVYPDVKVKYPGMAFHVSPIDVPFVDLKCEVEKETTYENINNIIPSSSDADKAVAKADPVIKGKLLGIALRVPTVDGPFVDLTCGLEKFVGYSEDQVVSTDCFGETCSTFLDAVAGFVLTPASVMKVRYPGMAFRTPPIDVSVDDPTDDVEKETTYEDIKAQVKFASQTYALRAVCYTEEQVVSSDASGETSLTIFDATTGIVLTPTYVKLISWCDDEWGYSTRVVDLVGMLTMAYGVTTMEKALAYFTARAPVVTHVNKHSGDLRMEDWARAMAEADVQVKKMIAAVRVVSVSTVVPQAPSTAWECSSIPSTLMTH